MVHVINEKYKAFTYYLELGRFSYPFLTIQLELSSVWLSPISKNPQAEICATQKIKFNNLIKVIVLVYF